MEQNIGIVLCICTCLLCLLEVILFGYSIYKKSIIGIIIHILGIAVSALLSIFLIAYFQKLAISFETDKVLLATVIAAFVFAVAVSIKSLFRDTEPTQNERIKEKRKKLREITDSKTQANDKENDLSSNQNDKKTNKILSNDNDKKVNKETKKEDTSKDDNKYNDSYDDKMTMVKRSQKGRKKKKKTSKKKT